MTRLVLLLCLACLGAGKNDAPAAAQALEGKTFEPLTHEVRIFFRYAGNGDFTEAPLFIDTEIPWIGLPYQELIGRLPLFVKSQDPAVKGWWRFEKLAYERTGPFYWQPYAVYRWWPWEPSTWRRQ